MNFLELNQKLQIAHQQHLLKYWDHLSLDQQSQLARQIQSLNLEQISALQELFIEEPLTAMQSLQPFQDYAQAGNFQDEQLGKQLISEGKVGCLIVAGGQGTRLGFDGPKGMFPITLVKHKTLFQLVAEKILAAGIQANRPLKVAIMTSGSNHEETVRYFEENHYFGLQKQQLSFFQQGELPLLDLQGNLFLETPSKIAEGPDGNGGSLDHFVQSGIWEDWYNAGIRYLNFILIDNPLADPFDAELVGYHHRHQGDVVVKCVVRRDDQEKVGILLNKDEKVHVVEYSECPQEEFSARNREGVLKHLCANISLFSFSMDFVSEAVRCFSQEISYHKAFKAIKYVDEEGKSVKAAKPMAWKFEKFIFDVLPFAKGVRALLYPREKCFAPLKNAEGMDSLRTVQEALQRFDREVFSKISGKQVETTRVFELDPQFYYPTNSILEKWKGRDLPDSKYIE